jgi:hypothetical protein
MKLTESKLRKIIREEARFLVEQEVVIEEFRDADFVSRKHFEKHYENDGEPASSIYGETVDRIREIDNKIHLLISRTMDHDKIDHGMGDRVPEYGKMPTKETVQQFVQNIERSIEDGDAEGDVAESFLELNRSLQDLHSQLHSVMAQHIRHHTDMGGNDDVVDNT